MKKQELKPQGKFIYINTEGKGIIPFEYDNITIILDDDKTQTDFVIIEKEEKYGIVKQGAFFLPLEYDDIHYSHTEKGILFTVAKNHWYGLIDKDGKIILPIIYSELFLIKISGILKIIVDDRENQNMISLDNDIIIPFEYTGWCTHEGCDFIGVYAGWNNNRKCGVIDIHGKLIVPCEHDQVNARGIKQNDDIFFRVRNNGKWGLVDNHGNYIFPCEYGKIFNTGDFYIRERDSKWSAVSLDGKTILPFEYEEIDNVHEVTLKRDNEYITVTLKKIENTKNKN
jgi:hypothetical protein